MAFTRSEVVLSTDPLRLARSPEDVRLSREFGWGDCFSATACFTRAAGMGCDCDPPCWKPPPTEEVVRHLAPPRARLRPDRDWHRVFGADGEPR